MRHSASYWHLGDKIERQHEIQHTMIAAYASWIILRDKFYTITTFTKQASEPVYHSLSW